MFFYDVCLKIKVISDVDYVSVGEMEVYNLLSSVAVRIPQHVTVQLAANVRQTVVVSETLYEMRNNALFCDTCIIGSDRRSLNAHACILAAVCPALQSQLTRKHQTNSTNICISTDSIDSIMWEKVLKLIYCAEVQLPVCDLVTFLDITRELDIKGVQVLYVPVMPLKKGCNLCFVNPGNDNPVHERHSTVNDAYFSRSASNDDSSQDQDIVVDKEGVGFGGDELKPDALVDSRSRVEALQSFEGADGTPSCLDNLTSLPELSDNNLQSTSVSPPVTMDVKQERDVEVNNRDTSSAAFIQSENKQSKAPDRSCLLTCKTEPTDSHEDMPQWCSVDSISAIQESDVLAEAFVSSGLMSSTDVFNRSQFFTSEHG